MPSEFEHMYVARTMRIYFMSRARQLWLLANESWKVTPQLYKSDHDKNICFRPNCAADDYMPVDDRPWISPTTKAWTRNLTQSQCQNDIVRTSCWDSNPNIWRFFEKMAETPLKLTFSGALKRGAPDKLLTRAVEPTPASISQRIPLRRPERVFCDQARKQKSRHSSTVLRSWVITPQLHYNYSVISRIIRINLTWTEIITALELHQLRVMYITTDLQDYKHLES